MTQASRTAVRAVAGPALIVAAVLAALHQFVFQGLIGKGDHVSFFLPRWCLLGSSLRAGDLPTWDPSVMGGVPFAADPQSGWMYLLPMALFTALPCDVAIVSMVALLPALGGVGLYWFLRGEGLSRPASATGGVMLALAICGSALVYSFPFTGTLAWTAVLLAACSRFLRAGSWHARVAWAVGAALVWGQLAAAHLSVGLVMGTLAAAVYVVAKSRAERRSPVETLGSAALFAVAVVSVNLALLLPRFPYLAHTSLSDGYGALAGRAAALGGPALRAFEEGVAPDWPLQFGLSNGAYLGAAVALSFAGWGLRRLRLIVAAFALYGAFMYLASLRVVANAVPEAIRSWAPVDAYLHRPEWAGYALVLVIPVLAAVGVDAWREGGSLRQKALMAGPGVLVWFALPFAFGAPAARGVLPLAGLVVGGLVLVAAVKRPWLVAAVPGVVAVQLVANSLMPFRESPFDPVPELLAPLPNPVFDAGALLEPGPIPRALRERTDGDGRVLMLGDPAELLYRYDVRLSLFGTEQVQGYGPTQLPRYWTLARKVAGRALPYNRTVFPDPPPAVLDLLQVAWVVVPGDELDAVPMEIRERLAPPVAVDGRWQLRPLTGASAARAAVVGTWRVVDGADASLAAVTGPGFDPAREVILEEPPRADGIPGGPGASADGTATYVALGRDAARIEVDASGTSILLVRMAFDPNWLATVDGQPAPVLAADHLIQGIAVPSGRHVVELRHDDPWIGRGLSGSGLALAAFAGAFVLLRRRDRRASRRPPVGDERPEPLTASLP